MDKLCFEIKYSNSVFRFSPLCIRQRYILSTGFRPNHTILELYENMVMRRLYILWNDIRINEMKTSLTHKIDDTCVNAKKSLDFLYINLTFHMFLWYWKDFTILIPLIIFKSLLKTFLITYIANAPDKDTLFKQCHSTLLNNLWSCA